MRRALQFLLLTLAFAAATWVAGWWAVPILGAVWGGLQRGERWVGTRTGCAAAAAWALLLVWGATQGPVGLVAQKLGSIMGLAPLVPYVGTLALAGVAAGSAAGFAASVIPSNGSVRQSAG